MQLVGETSLLEACSIIYNLYDCDGTVASFYVTIACAVLYYTLAMFSAAVIVYRLYHRLDMAPFRRVSGYYVPIPLTCLLFINALINIVRGAHFTLLLLDLPHSWTLRGAWLALTLITSQALLQQFTLGVIAHISPTFSQAFQEQDIFTLMYVPSPRVIFWSNLISSAVGMVVHIGNGVWFGWQRDSGASEQYELGVRMVLVPASIIFLLLVVPCVYYAHGFYRIANRHASQWTGDNDTMQSLRLAARRFRTVFLLMFITYASVVVAGVMVAVLGHQLRRKEWLNLLIYGSGNSVFWTATLFALVYSVLQSSMAFVQRAAALQTDTTDDNLWDTLSTRVERKPADDHGTGDKSTMPLRSLVGLASTRLLDNACPIGVDDYTGTSDAWDMARIPVSSASILTDKE